MPALKYTFDMGGAGDLLSLSLNVPHWEDLHELSGEELRLTNLVTTVAENGTSMQLLQAAIDPASAGDRLSRVICGIRRPLECDRHGYAQLR
jgi:hypothetical protein